MSSRGHTQFSSRRDVFSSFNLKYLLLSDFTGSRQSFIISTVSRLIAEALNQAEWLHHLVIIDSQGVHLVTSQLVSCV